jgi:DNA polymerase (family 10)
MSAGTKLHAAAARPVAERLLAAIAPACERCDIAGSLRRGRETVGDIEIVAQPIVTLDMFGDTTGQYPQLDAVIAGLIRTGAIAFDIVIKRDGPRLKRFVVHELGGFVFEIFIAQAGNYGNQLVIRTGPAEYSTWIMTTEPYGAMPRGLRQADGFLWRGTERLVCNSEADYYAALGLPVLPPSERDTWLERRR